MWPKSRRRKALFNAHVLAVPVTAGVGPAQIVESYRVDDKGIALPSGWLEFVEVTKFGDSSRKKITPISPISMSFLSFGILTCRCYYAVA
jgi:hypothetical protein